MYLTIISPICYPYYMKQSCILKELATIHSGYSLRNPFEEFSYPNVEWVQPSHVTAQNFFHLPRITVKLAKNITVLQTGDVLLTSRVNFKAALISEETSVPTLASVGIWIIRPNKKYLHPGFLTLWLNSGEGQKALQGLGSEFTTIKFIRKEDLEGLNIPVPPMDKQEKLANLYTCYIKQKILLEKRLDLQQQLLNSLAAKL